MTNNLIRLSVRSVAEETVEKLNYLRSVTRLPMGALVEDAVAALWEQHVDEGFELPDFDYDNAA
ncbi:MAG: hypothetical protein GXP05_11500 [Alphaproteobacteria bacterium]|nr:hypothetical protein [Alphaproteobacteria bacterium]